MLNPIHHYSIENPPTVFDEEAMTVLQLCGRLAAAFNETVKQFNELEKHTAEEFAELLRSVLEHLARQDEEIRQWESNHEDAIPGLVAQWLLDHPEIVTTIKPGEITVDKLHNSLRLMVENIYVTPEMYGARGDGMTDDSTAFQTAANTGKYVMLTPGRTYAICSTVSIGSNTHLAGNNATIYCGEKTAFDVVGNNATIDNVFFCPLPSGNGVTTYGVSVGVVKNTRLSNIRGLNLTYSLIMNNGENTIVQGCYAEECGWDCVSNYTQAKNATIQNCTAIRCERHGFSTDEGAQGIRFVNCYAEDIGRISGEGHSCFHFEGADDSGLINCKAVYTQAHRAYTEQFTGPLIGCRVESAHGRCRNVTIDGLEIIYGDDFRAIYENEVIPIYLHNVGAAHTVNIRNLRIYNGMHLPNLEEYVPCPAMIYLGSAKVRLSGFECIGDIQWKQQSNSGMILTMENGTVENNTLADGFYYPRYMVKGLHCHNVNVKNAAAFIKGLLVNCLIEDCTFDSGNGALILLQNSTNSSEKSNGNMIRNNLFRNITNPIALGWWTGDENNHIINNAFCGDCETLVTSSYAGCVFSGNMNTGITRLDMRIHDEKTTLFYIPTILEIGSADSGGGDDGGDDGKLDVEQMEV